MLNTDPAILYDSHYQNQLNKFNKVTISVRAYEVTKLYSHLSQKGTVLYSKT